MERKNFIKCLVLATAVLLTTSCSQEDTPGSGKGNGDVTFSVSLDGIPQTRAFGDGLSALDLTCAVYQDNNFITKQTATFSNRVANVRLQLLEGQSYNIVFFASRGTDVYTFDTNTAKVSIDYANMNKGLDAAQTAHIDDDCFYALREGYVAGSSLSEEVTLRRPVAQVNFGSDDQEATSTTKNFPDGIFSKMTLKAYSTLNLLTGAAEGDATTVSLPVMKYDDLLKSEQFPYQGEEGAEPKYRYLAMGYVLVPAEGFVTDITLDVQNGETATAPVVSRTVPNAPLKRNFRTNIYGSLLTSESGWDILIDENWSGEYNISDLTAESDLGKGGIFNVSNETATIEIPENLEAPLTLNVKSKVDAIKIGNNTAPVTVNVAKDVDYPAFEFTSGSTVDGLTITGDPASTKSLAGFDFFSNSSLTRPAALNNLTIEGVTFTGTGFEPKYTVSTLNTVIRNCKFLSMTRTAIDTQQDAGGGDETCENLIVEGCVFEYAADAPANLNGVYILDVTGDVVFNNNTISSPTYHGAFICGLSGGAPTNVTMKGNTISGAAKDGVKLENITGNIEMTGNNIASKENGIRLKNAIGTADVTITENTIDMQNAIPWDGSSEPSGILLVNSAENAGAKVIVSNNTVKNSNGHDFTTKNIIYAEGSDVTAPFK